MSDRPSPAPEPGTPAWFDLTVEDADGLRAFYADLLGWRTEHVPMGAYDDFNMTGPDGSPLAGICHARGTNADLPPVWMIYFTVRELDAALTTVRDAGGEMVQPPRAAGGGRYAVIRDPAGVACALWQADGAPSGSGG